MVRSRVMQGLLLSYCGAVTLAGCNVASGLDNIDKHEEHLCEWLADAGNCHAQFFAEVEASCGYSPVLDSDILASFTGDFYSRSDMRVCLKHDRGQVLFEPAPAVNDLSRVPLGIQLFDQKANACGAIQYNGRLDYSVEIRSRDEPTRPDKAHSFRVERQAGDRLVISCSDGVHNLNLENLQECPELATSMPRAVLDSNPGVPDTATPGSPGFFRLRLHFPPTGSSAPGAEPRIVEYFNCSVPPPPAPCSNQIKDNGETDIDCGGHCSFKCSEGQKCNTNLDCDTSIGLFCGLVGGLKLCMAG